ncbi:substrate-binding domain-containing protein, partial [Nakamurella sp.]|uniref:substrate-binding domain-containing protein n=1 Tax=Nakamurella sp. TaxID=1869182 RepID=UPI003B3A469D
GANTYTGATSVAGGTLTVAAAPEIAPVLAAVTQREGLTAAGCAVAIEPADPAEVASSGTTGAAVWIPDASMWLARAAAAGLAVPDRAPSIATSPVVFALSGSAAQQLAASGGSTDVAGLLATRRTAAPIRIGLADPDRSAAAVAAVLAARASVTGTPDARAALTWAVRSSPDDLPVPAGDLLDRLAADPSTAVAVGEQAVVARDRSAGGDPIRVVYPGAGAFVLDYPVSAVGTDPATRAAAADLAAAFGSDPVRAALQDAGFRAPDQSAGPALPTGGGLDPNHREPADPPTAQAVDDAIRSVQLTNEPSRMLAVMDISGSMRAAVPGTDEDRIGLAKEAAARGLGLYRADSDIGLWEFSTDLTPTSDHRELIGISSLGPDGQGSTGAARLAAALNGLRAIPNGGTGLYNTTLDAVRTVRAGYDPARVNAVLLLTDGINDDVNSISLDQLLSTLTAEQDPARPVPVIAIAFGPDSDVGALQQISKVTGGATYLSQDPRQIGEIFLDAVGQRLCRPSC